MTEVENISTRSKRSREPNYGSFPDASGINQDAFDFSGQSGASEPLLNDSSLPVRNRNSRWTRFLGISIALSSGVFMTIYSSLLKLLIEMDSMQVALVRGVIQVIFMSLILVIQRGSLSVLKKYQDRVASCCYCHHGGSACDFHILVLHQIASWGLHRHPFLLTCYCYGLISLSSQGTLRYF